jgi:hypothetical protein
MTTKIGIGLMGVCSNYHGHKKLQAKDITRKTNHKKCKPKSNPRLETQRRKTRTWYMLEDDSNKTLLW